MDYFEQQMKSVLGVQVVLGLGPLLWRAFLP
jgi:hypothetical protein